MNLVEVKVLEPAKDTFGDRLSKLDSMFCHPHRWRYLEPILEGLSEKEQCDVLSEVSWMASKYAGNSGGVTQREMEIRLGEYSKEIGKKIMEAWGAWLRQSASDLFKGKAIAQ